MIDLWMLLASLTIMLLYARMVSYHSRILECEKDLDVLFRNDMRVEVIEGKLHRGTNDAACWDIFASEEVTILPGQQVVVPTGLKTCMFGVDALIFSRSGLAAKFRISHRAGVIDEKYPGYWGVVLVNEGREAYTVRIGDKIAQCMFVPKSEVKVSGAATTGGTRVGGFGSTG